MKLDLTNGAIEQYNKILSKLVYRLSNSLTGFGYIDCGDKYIRKDSLKPEEQPEYMSTFERLKAEYTASISKIKQEQEENNTLTEDKPQVETNESSTKQNNECIDNTVEYLLTFKKKSAVSKNKTNSNKGNSGRHAQIYTIKYKGKEYTGTSVELQKRLKISSYKVTKLVTINISSK